MSNKNSEIYLYKKSRLLNGLLGLEKIISLKLYNASIKNLRLNATERILIEFILTAGISSD